MLDAEMRLLRQGVVIRSQAQLSGVDMQKHASFLEPLRITLYKLQLYCRAFLSSGHLSGTHAVG